MNDFIEVSGKTVEDAITQAKAQLGVTSDQLEYEIVEKGSSGFFGIGSKDAVVRARRKTFERPEKKKKEQKTESFSQVEEKEIKAVEEKVEKAEVKETFDDKKTGGFKETVVSVKTIDQREDKERVPLDDAKKAEVIEKTMSFTGALLTKMGIENHLKVDFNDEEQAVEIDVSGPDMGALIGKRGQTLYAVQYLVSLYVNKFTEDYIRIKIDTENYKERRKASLEKLAANMANKVKKTHRSVEVEPMNPYERRIIHSTLQGNPYVETYSEGVDPYRKIIIAPKR